MIYIIRFIKKQILSLITFVLLGANTFAKTNPDFKPLQNTAIAFTENKGQVHDQNYAARPDVLYGVMTGNMAVHIKNNGVSYQLYRIDSYKETEDPKTKEKRSEPDQQTIYRIDLNWLNCNKNFTKTEDETSPGYSNYYLESCPQGALKVKSYKGVTLKNLYIGIDLHYYEKNNELKHDYIVAAHADYKQIQVQVEGAEISANEDGSLILTTPLGKIQEGAPIVFQNGQQLKAKWIVKNNILSFEIEKYNSNYELIIDPVTRVWGTYYGGTSGDIGYSCTTDASGNVYLTGNTGSNTGTVIATVGSHQSTFGGGTNYDAFLVKFDANGTRQWGTYYGGLLDDEAYSCATDANGNVYLAGYTSSNTGTIIATSGSHQSAYGGGPEDGFLIKFDNSGIRQWGTYYGGTGDDYGYSCATDANGNVYLSGATSSSTSIIIATVGSHQSTYAGNGDSFLVKFNSSGVRQWGTYYGGTIGEGGGYCATDASGNIYLSGRTTSNTSTLIANVGSHQSGFGGGLSDAFLVKFDAGGIRQWGTYYGGTGQDGGQSCTADASGNVYMSGYTATNTGTLIASSGSHQSSYGGGSNYDAFLVKFDASGIRQWGTYYGGTGDETGYSCTTDALGNVYMAGGTSTNTGTIMATIGSHQPSFGGGTDAFLVKFDPLGVRQWGTYYGGTAGDVGYSCSSDPVGNIYMAGYAISNTGTVIATGGSQQNVYGGGPDAFLVKFDACDVAPGQPTAINGFTTSCVGAVSSYSTPIAFGANSYTWSLPGGWIGSGNSNTILATPGSSGTFTLTAGNACGVSPQQTLAITVNALPTISVNSGSICSGQSFTLIASGANSYTYSNGSVVSPIVTSSYTVSGTSAVGCSNTAVTTVTVDSPTITVNSGAICIGGSFAIIPGGAGTYTITGGSFSVNPSTQTSYSVTGTSAGGCVSSNTAVATVIVNPLPIVSVNSGTICAGSNFVITPSGANTYSVTGGNFIVSPVTPTSYSVTGTSAAGCVSSNTAVSNVAVNSLPSVNASTTNSLLCTGESATLTATGAAGYTFNPGGTGASITVSPNITSTYIVTGTDANGCSNTAMITQNVDECLGINNNLVTSGGVELFPNPTKGIINLKLDSENEVIILNAIGQIVYSSKLSEGAHQINLEGFARGVYAVKVNNAAYSKNFKLIKE